MSEALCPLDTHGAIIAFKHMQGEHDLRLHKLHVGVEQQEQTPCYAASPQEQNNERGVVHARNLAHG